MKNVPTLFQFESNSVRVITDENGEPLFVGKDICDVLGYVRSSDAMQQHCKRAAIYRPFQTPGGMQKLRVLSEMDVMRLMTHSKLPSAEAFERLIFEEILSTIRKTGSYTAKTTKSPNPTAELTQANRYFRSCFGIAKLIGCDKNAAAISANQAVIKITGTNVLSLLGQTHLIAEQQILFFTPTDLGKHIGVGAVKFNILLEEAGLQINGKVKTPTSKAKGLYRIVDTGKRQNNGTPVQQVKWSEEVIDKLMMKAA